MMRNKLELLLICERVPPPIIPLYSDILRVHVFPHSHMDMGWLETFENYYKNHVYYILNDVIESLS